MAIAKRITQENVVYFLPVRNQKICRLSLFAGGSDCQAELYDGTIGTLLTFSISNAGTDYEVGEILVVEASVAAGETTEATIQVDTVDTGGEILTATLLSGGTGYVVGNVYGIVSGSDAGINATITVVSIEDEGESFAKVSAVENSSEDMYLNHLSTRGVSARLTGNAPQAYIYYE